MSDKSNPLLEAYITETEREQDELLKGWVHTLRKHYLALIAEGFTPKQAMQLVERLWIQVDERQMRKEKL